MLKYLLLLLFQASLIVAFHSEAATIIVSYPPYSANPFGAEDATDKIQRAIDESLPGDIIHLGNGTYKISRMLNLKSDRTLSAYFSASGKGTLSWAGAVGGTILSVGKNSKILYVTLDGKLRARIGLTMPQYTTNVWAHGINVKSLRGTSTTSAYGILIPQGCGTSTQPIQLTGSVSNPLVISDINGAPNGIVGDSIGANRGIWMTNSHVSLKSCIIEKIGPAEDGDAIHVQASTRVNVSIDSCRITEFEKRGIKVQASGVKLTNNAVSTSKQYAYAGIEFIGNITDGIIQKNSIATTDNVVLTHGIALSGNNHTVTGNIINILGNQTTTNFGVVNAIKLYMANYNNVNGNEIRNAPFNGIRIINSSFNTVKNNIINTDILSRRIVVEGSSSQNIISNP